MAGCSGVVTAAGVCSDTVVVATLEAGGATPSSVVTSAHGTCCDTVAVVASSESHGAALRAEAMC